MRPFLMCGVLIGMSLLSIPFEAAAQTGEGAMPGVMQVASNLTGLWARSDPEARFLPPVSGPGPLVDDPAHPHHGHREGIPGRPDEAATPWVADMHTNILQPWVFAIVKKNGDDSIAGIESNQDEAYCRPDGVPGALMLLGNVQFLARANEVTIVYQMDHQVRHIYLNRPHSAHPVQSYYGESVGHYEGDTLVVDTIGMNDKTLLDHYNTPHSDQIHTVERYRAVDGGKTLEVSFTVDDPKAFTTPWSAVAHYRRSRAEFEEIVCAENNVDIRTGKAYPIPTAEHSDF